MCDKGAKVSIRQGGCVDVEGRSRCGIVDWTECGCSVEEELGLLVWT